jgi:hypothetical protein
MSLAKDVAQSEYMTRTVAYYLRREPYEPAVEKYIQDLANQHGVSVAEVKKVRAAYVKKHPLNWQQQAKNTTKKVKKTSKKSRGYTRRVAVAE